MTFWLITIKLHEYEKPQFCLDAKSLYIRRGYPFDDLFSQRTILNVHAHSFYYYLLNS